MAQAAVTAFVGHRGPYLTSVRQRLHGGYDEQRKKKLPDFRKRQVLSRVVLDQRGGDSASPTSHPVYSMST